MAFKLPRVVTNIEMAKIALKVTFLFFPIWWSGTAAEFGYGVTHRALGAKGKATAPGLCLGFQLTALAFYLQKFHRLPSVCRSSTGQPMESGYPGCRALMASLP